jgi:hypothetical protein
MYSSGWERLYRLIIATIGNRKTTVITRAVGIANKPTINAEPQFPAGIACLKENNTAAIDEQKIASGASRLEEGVIEIPKMLLD